MDPAKPPTLDYRPNPEPRIDGIEPIPLRPPANALLPVVALLGIAGLCGLLVHAERILSLPAWPPLMVITVLGLAGIGRHVYLLSRAVDSTPAGLRERFFRRVRLIPWESVAFVRESEDSQRGTHLFIGAVPPTRSLHLHIARSTAARATSLVRKRLPHVLWIDERGGDTAGHPDRKGPARHLAVAALRRAVRKAARDVLAVKIGLATGVAGGIATVVIPGVALKERAMFMATSLFVIAICRFSRESSARKFSRLNHALGKLERIRGE